jgi:hypothetical protein
MENKSPFFIIVLDKTQGVFSIEGPVADDRAWSAIVDEANALGGNFGCDAIGTNCMSAAEIVEEYNWHGFKLVEMGSILRLA